MSQSSAFPLRACGLLVFLATAGIGWNLFRPAPSPAEGLTSGDLRTKHDSRPGRTARSVAEENAAKRMGGIRAAANPEARMLATLSLAESLSPADFAAWVDGGWFDLRGGPELMMFSKILMDRWKAEDPEGLLMWASKNNNGVGGEIMENWAEKDPQRLLAWFQSNRNDQAEIHMLGIIAGHSPDLALQRLRELTEAGMAEDAMRNASGLMHVLAGKNPAALEGLLASLPPDLRIQAESALSKKRLEASFSEEIRNLWERPDGWRIFSSMENSPEVWKKMMGELANLPDEWRRMLASNSYQFVRHDPRAWLEMDLGAAGFSAAEIRSVRSQAVQNLAWEDPALAIEHLGKGGIDPGLRKHILEMIFRSGNQENLRELAAQLPEEDQKTANALMDGRQESRTLGVGTMTTPDELLEKILKMDPAIVGSGSFPMLSSWDRGKIEALAQGFVALPDEQKAKAAIFITSNPDYSSAPPELQGVALRYLAGQPEASPDGKKPQDVSESLTAKVSNHATNLAMDDPVAAASWVGSLPVGEARTWAQRNVLKNWKQYDPDAAKAWEKSLSAADREALGKITH